MIMNICLILLAMSPQELRGEKRGSGKCQYWLSKVDAKVKLPPGSQNVDETSSQTILEGIECLLQTKGNKHPAKFSGATKPYVSQIFKPATVEVAALYYISYLYYQKWDHADAIALRDETGSVNSPKAIGLAYDSYRKWFEEVRRLGIAKAREMNLDPLKDAKVRWY